MKLSGRRLYGRLRKSNELGIRIERVPEFDHETALYVRRIE
jgi:hypothetical protein